MSNMKRLRLLCLLAITLNATIASDGDLFDKMDLRKVLDNEEQLEEAFSCLMDRGPCDRYQLIRDKAPNILKSDCDDCTSGQRAKYESLIKRFAREHTHKYKEMMSRYT